MDNLGCKWCWPFRNVFTEWRTKTCRPKSFYIFLRAGVAAYCCCRSRTRSENNSAGEGRDEQRPLLSRLRLRDRLARRSTSQSVPLQDLHLESGEVTPVSIASNDAVDYLAPIIREPRARFHRSGEGMQVTIEVKFCDIFLVYSEIFVRF